MLSLDALIAYHKAKMTTYRINYCHIVKHRNTSKESDLKAYKELRLKDFKNYKLHMEAVKTLEYMQELRDYPESNGIGGRSNY